FDSSRWMLAVLLHVVGAAVFTVASLYGSAFIFVALKLIRGPVGQRGTEFLLSSMADQVAIYCAIVAAFHALDFSREARRRERERAQLEASLREAQLDALRSQ